ncbi:MAG: hypothetical protein U7127_23490 [Phormidium sp.]
MAFVFPHIYEEPLPTLTIKDNALIAMGIRSLGLIDQSLELFQGLIDMTLAQPYQRPPELFCGYERDGDNDPVRYPVACSPQAWATGSIFQLLQMMINLVPDAPNNCLRIIAPALPESITSLYLQNLKVGSTFLDLEFQRSGNTTSCRVAKKRGNLRVVTSMQSFVCESPLIFIENHVVILRNL